MKRFIQHGKAIFVFLTLAFLVNATEVSAQDRELQSRKLKSGDVETRRDVLHDLRNENSGEASAIAAEALADSDEIVRATAPFSVLALPPDEAVTKLLPQLSDSSEFVRRETALALGETRSLQAVAPLVKQLKTDKFQSVQAYCAIALGKIGDISALDALNEVLSRKFDKKDEFTRFSSARAIGEIAQTAGKTPQVSTNQVLPLTQKFPVFQQSAPLLIKLLQNSKETNEVKREALFALGEIGDQSAIPSLQTFLQSEDSYLAQNAAEALKKIQK